MWVSQGGSETLSSYGVDPNDVTTWHKINPDDLRYLTALPMVWQSTSFIATHALATPETLTIARARFLSSEGTMPSQEGLRLACRDLAWRRAMPHEAPTLDQVHVSGHTPLDQPNRVKRLNLIRIDTGCVYGGLLTAWCGEADHVISVQPEA